MCFKSSSVTSSSVSGFTPGIKKRTTVVDTDRSFTRGKVITPKLFIMGAENKDIFSGHLNANCFGTSSPKTNVMYEINNVIINIDIE